MSGEGESARPRLRDIDHAYPFYVEAKSPDPDAERWAEEQQEIAEVDAEIEADWDRESEED